MLEQKNFLNITLYPLEALPKETAVFYEHRYDVAERNNITQYQKNWNQIAEAISNKNLDNAIDRSNHVEVKWTDPQKPWWIWINMESEEFQQWAEQWDPEKAKLYNAEQNLQEEIYPYTSSFSLRVYLPAD